MGIEREERYNNKPIYLHLFWEMTRGPVPKTRFPRAAIILSHLLGQARELENSVWPQRLAEQGELRPDATLGNVGGQCPPVLRLKSGDGQAYAFQNNTLWGRYTFCNTSERKSSRTLLPRGHES